MKPGWYVLLALALGTATCVGVKSYRARQTPRTLAGGTAESTVPPYDKEAYDTHAPDESHITVEVINATRTPGLARRATLYLRDRGFDVVFVGTSRELHPHTLVLDRSGHPAWAKLIAKAMHGESASRPDTTRYVDATVLVGSDWTPPPLPLHP